MFEILVHLHILLVSMKSGRNMKKSILMMFSVSQTLFLMTNKRRIEVLEITWKVISFEAVGLENQFSLEANRLSLDICIKNCERFKFNRNPIKELLTDHEKLVLRGHTFHGSWGFLRSHWNRAKFWKFSPWLQQITWIIFSWNSTW